jgi:retron-type reverse transcriptase
VNWVLDADLRDFFGPLEHSQLIRFVERRIGDKRVVRLIQQWLAAGVLEDGAWTRSETGTPQGGSISPLAANLYMHYDTAELTLGASTGCKSRQCQEWVPASLTTVQSSRRR